VSRDFAAAESSVAAAASVTFPDCQAVRKALAVVVTSVADRGPVFTSGFWPAEAVRLPSSAEAPPPYSA
jgi:hypothetical protein